MWFGVVLGTLTGVMFDTLTNVMVGVAALKFADPVSCTVDVLREAVVNALAGVIFRVVSDMGVGILAAATNALEFAMPVS